MSRRLKYDDIPASDRVADVFAAEVLAASLRPAPHRLDAICLVQEARSKLRPMPRYEKRTTPTQIISNGDFSI